MLARQLVNLIWNSNFQSLFLSPLIGALMGLLLTYLLTPPTDTKTTANKSYVQAVHIFYKEVHHYYHGASPENDPSLLLGFLLMGGTTWLYITDGEVLIKVLQSIAAFILFASLTFIMRRLLAQAGEGWLFRFACPTLIAILSLILLFYDENAMSSIVRDGLNFHDFLRMFGHKSFFIVGFSAGGLLFLAGALVFSLIALIHQIAFGSMIDPEGIFSLRGRIVRKTANASRATGFVLSFVFLGMSWLRVAAHCWIIYLS